MTDAQLNRLQRISVVACGTLGTCDAVLKNSSDYNKMGLLRVIREIRAQLEKACAEAQP